MGPPPPGAPPVPPGPAFDWQRLRGSWGGSAAIAGIGLVTSWLLGLGIVLLARPSGFGTGNTLNLATSVAAGIFGADTATSGSDGGDDYVASAGVFPLTLTVVVLGLLVVLFARMVRRYTSPWPALTDAVTVALTLALGMMVLSIVFRGNLGEIDELGAEFFFGDDINDFGYGVNVVGAFFMTFFVVLVVLALAVLLHRSWWSPRARRFLETVSAPLYGYAVLVALLPLVGLIGFLLLGFGEPSLDEARDEEGGVRAVCAALIALTANGGVALMALGSGSSLGAAGQAKGLGENDSDSTFVHLWNSDVAGEEPGLWASPAVLVVLLAVAALVVVRRAATRERATSALLLWVIGLLVVVPVLVRLANGHGSFDAEIDGGSYRGHGVIGAHGVQTTFYVTGIALLVALAVAAATRTLDLGSVGAQMRGFAARLQQDAGHPAHPTAPMPVVPPPVVLPPGAWAPPQAPPPQAPPTQAPPTQAPADWSRPPPDPYGPGNQPPPG